MCRDQRVIRHHQGCRRPHKVPVLTPWPYSWFQGRRQPVLHLHILCNRWLPKRWPAMLTQKRVYRCLDAVLHMLPPMKYRNLSIYCRLLI